MWQVKDGRMVFCPLPQKYQRPALEAPTPKDVLALFNRNDLAKEDE